MNKIQREYDLVERPFCRQLQAMGWQWIGSEEGFFKTAAEVRDRVTTLEEVLRVTEGTP
jgi:type I restriction enzyme R subunit